MKNNVLSKNQGRFRYYFKKKVKKILSLIQENIANNPRKNAYSFLLIHYKKKQGRTL